MSVGVAALDNDHKKLTGMVNELFDGIMAGQGKDAVGKILDGLVAYTTQHFGREEQFFAQTGYPDAAAHKAQHQDLCKQVLAVQEKYRAGATAALSIETLHFLKSWLINHIQGTDKEYGPHLNARGIK
jgi:hemerythrin-like metal-binding protein